MDLSLYEKPLYTDPFFPLRITFEQHANEGILFQKHWHEEMELLFITQGHAAIEINSNTFEAKEGDLLIINSNELHQGIGFSKNVSYYCMIIDTSSLHNSFIETYTKNRTMTQPNDYTLIKNIISGDTTVRSIMDNLTVEQTNKNIGYELYVKSSVIYLIGYLVRHYGVKTLNEQKHTTRLKNLNRLNKVLEYIDTHYYEDLTVNEAAKISNLSPYYFCRLFKTATGRSFVQYVNERRIEKAHMLLTKTDLSIMEVALQTGFNDANYFSRAYKKLRKESPSTARKGHIPK
ncbi:AraC family transcriptional regulator [Alkalihalobacillus sp. 1P02AB]|uniref:AraC family transcriptional regulator n=1 Tax=Alkalihalobacillus sp. 1P02AB TaxID=3132260 RepID=UPI0039A75937